VALLRIEAVLVNLDRQLGDSVTPEELAALVSGEGGTAKLFEPLAKRAMKQIESQLDVAETKVTDPTALEMLRRVRKIMSGQLTIHNVMDEIVSILNDDQVVAAGESLVQRSEHVLDAIEGASGNQAVSDALKLAEKAGITKDTVMKEMEKLDVNELIDTAGSAVTDERSRRKLLSQATDTALDFLLRILPSMPVPPFEGVNEGLVYTISNLSMEGFKVRKEDIQIELAGMRATRRASSLHVLNAGVTDRLNGYCEPSHGSNIDASFDVEELHSKVKATELLIIDIRNISAVLDNANYSFEQTYMPYLKGQGMANVKLSGGSIRLQFELRKKRTTEGKAQSSECEPGWEPVLCLHNRTCTIGDVELTLPGQGSLNWIINKLASIFKGPLRDYVVRTIVNVLTSRSGWILERLNSVLGPYWDLILRSAQLDMVSLECWPVSDRGRGSALERHISSFTNFRCPSQILSKPMRTWS
jgi:nucleotide-binding universal stress UspA family protein